MVTSRGAPPCSSATEVSAELLAAHSPPPEARRRSSGGSRPARPPSRPLEPAAAARWLPAR
eukprot:4919051-Prymnesium_polylepis.1